MEKRPCMANAMYSAAAKGAETLCHTRLSSKTVFLYIPEKQRLAIIPAPSINPPACLYPLFLSGKPPVPRTKGSGHRLAPATLRA